MRQPNTSGQMANLLGAGFGGERSGDGAYGEPFCGAGDAAQDTSPFGDADGFVSFVSQEDGLGFLVSQVGLGGR